MKNIRRAQLARLGFKSCLQILGLVLGQSCNESSKFVLYKLIVFIFFSQTGRLFIRNLAYICREEDLESLFTKYGEFLILLGDLH